MGTGSFPGVKRPGRGADHPPPSKCRDQERVGLYLYSPSGPSWPVIGRTLPMDQLTILAEDIVHLEYCTTQGSISVDICINLDDVSFTNISMNVVLYVCEVLH